MIPEYEYEYEYEVDTDIAEDAVRAFIRDAQGEHGRPANIKIGYLYTIMVDHVQRGNLDLTAFAGDLREVIAEQAAA